MSRLILKKGEVICWFCRGNKMIPGMGNSGKPEPKKCPNCNGEGVIPSEKRYGKKTNK